MKDTYLGLTYNNYGKKYGIVSTHLSGPELLEDESLVTNSLIISSPVNGDIGGTLSDAKDTNVSHAMFFTDYKGIATRLTYTILPGNGLVVNAYWNNDGITDLSETNHPYSPDTLTFEIDKDSLKTISLNGQLQVSKPDIIDNYTLMVTQEFNSMHSYIGVVTANLDKATDIKYGIVRGDNSTISANNGLLTVNTQNLNYIDDETNTPGIVRPNPDLPEDQYDWRTIEATNGVLKVLTYNLDRATETTVGVVKPEGITTTTDYDGTISVITAGLDKASFSDNVLSYGIVRPDNFTVEIQNIDGQEYPGVLYANAENMTPTRIEDGISYFGVVKLDPVSLGIDTANNTYVNRYPEIVALIDRYLGDYTYIINWLVDHENRITTLEHQNVEMIASFNNYGTNITSLDMPIWDPELQVVHSEEKFYSVQFSIVTNCKFHISVEYQNNVAPGITLHSVKMGDNPPVSGSGLSNYMFESTNMNENTLNFEFLCNNYSSLTAEGNTPTTVFINVASINDSSVYKTGAHIFKRWNIETFKEPVLDEPIIKQVNRVSYTLEPITQQNKNLYFMVPDGENEYEITYSFDVSMSSMTLNQPMNSYSFYIVAEENLRYVRRLYYDKYQNGVLIYYDTEGVIDTSYNKTITKYFSLSLGDDSNNVGGFTLDTSFDTYHRNSIVDHSNVEWIEDTELLPLEKQWFNYNISNVASNTIVKNGKGYNIFDVMTTKPISTTDRKATLTLDLNNISPEYSEYDTWNNTQLKINYIEDIVDKNINAFVKSIIPQNNTVVPSTTKRLLYLHITRTDNISLSSIWIAKMQYCYNTLDGNLNNIGNEPISSNEITQIFNIHEQTPISEMESIMNDENSTLDKMSIYLNSDVTDAEITITLDNNGDTHLIYDDSQIQGFVDGDGNILNTDNGEVIRALIPQSVIDYMNHDSESNMFTGFNIVNCILEGNDFENYNLHYSIDWESKGIWPNNAETNTSITFGDAYINNISITPWDDTAMDIEFNIMGGLMTNIPVGSTLSFEIPYSNIYPDVVLFNDSNSYDYSEFYDNIIIKADETWNPLGTKVKMTLNNVMPNISGTSWHVVAPIGTHYGVYDSSHDFANDERFATETSIAFVNTQNGGYNGMMQTNVISGSSVSSGSNVKGTDNLTNYQHQQTNSNAPLVQKITAIMFNFILSATYNGKKTTLYFGASSGPLTDKVYISAKFNNGATKDVTISNGLLNYSPSTASNVQQPTQETLDTLSYMYNQINSLNSTVQQLVNSNSTTINN